MRRLVGSCLIVVLATASAIEPALAAPAGAKSNDKKECLAATNKGQDLRGEGKLRAAREQFLSCARDVCPPTLRIECTKWATDIDADIPSIVVRVTRDDVDVSDAKVTIDGEALEALDGKPIALDPGPHLVVVDAGPSGLAGPGQRIEQKLVLGTGEKNRNVTLALPSGKKPIDSIASPAPLGVAAAPSVANHGGAPSWAYVAGGVGIVGLGAFGFFAATGVHDVNRLDRECAPRCPDSDVDAAKRKLLFADIGLGVAIVGLGLATYGFLSAKQSDGLDADSSTTKHVSTRGVTAHGNVQVLPGGGAFASVSGAF